MKLDQYFGDELLGAPNSPEAMRNARGNARKAVKRGKPKNASKAVRMEAPVLHNKLDFFSLEQYKLLRANLAFTVPEGVKCPIIGVTSAVRGEGKSTTAINLSYVLAESGKKVLLIDGDMRLPTIARRMNIASSPGLSELLVGKSENMADPASPVLPNWFILPSGRIPPNPSELLGSRRMDAILKDFSAIFDFIVIDLAPVNLVSDALYVSPAITGMIVVVRENYSEKKAIQECISRLKPSGVKIMGFVLNDTKSRGSGYGKYGKSKYHKYGYYADESAKTAAEQRIKR